MVTATRKRVIYLRSTTGSLHQIGIIIRNARLNKGWTPQEVADRAGVCKATVLAFEKSERFTMTHRTLVSIIEVFGYKLELKSR